MVSTDTWHGIQLVAPCVCLWFQCKETPGHASQSRVKGACYLSCRDVQYAQHHFTDVCIPTVLFVIAEDLLGTFLAGPSLIAIAVE